MRGRRLGSGALKAGDYALFAAGLFLVAYLFARTVISAPAGREVTVKAGSVTERYRLDEDRALAVDGPIGRTEVLIRGGEVWVADSPCKDKVCVRMGKKRRAGEQIICLPNRVVVELVGETAEFDAVAR